MKIEIVNGCHNCDLLNWDHGSGEYSCNGNWDCNSDLVWYKNIPKEVPQACPLRKQPICYVLKIEE